MTTVKLNGRLERVGDGDVKGIVMLPVCVEIIDGEITLTIEAGVTQFCLRTDCDKDGKVWLSVMSRPRYLAGDDTAGGKSWPFAPGEELTDDQQALVDRYNEDARLALETV